MSNFLKRILKTVICSTISFFIWFGLSKCFAVENIPQTVQDNYYATINWYNSTTSNGIGKGISYFNSNYIPSQLMTKNIADIILNDVDNKILNYMTEEEIIEYKYYNLIFNSSEKYLGLYISKNCSQNSTSNYNLDVSDLHYFKYNYDADYNLSFVYHTYVPDTIYTINSYAYSTSGLPIRSIFLGTDNINDFTYISSCRYTGPFVKGLTISSSTTYPNVDPTKDYDNNFVLNWNNLKGEQLTLDYDIFYYDENGNAVSIKDLVYYLSENISYGTVIAYYLSPENIKLLPNNTIFYLRSIFKTNYNYITSSYGPLIISDNTTKMFTTGTSGTGGDTGGGGGSEGGGDTGGTSVDLSNIENTLGDINTSIIEVGAQTNENLDEIHQSIQDLNNTITSVPDLSQKEEITGDDIIENLGFETTVNPYDNFWSTLVDEFQIVLTSNNNRTITLEFRGETYTISVDDFNFNKIPSILRNFLQLFSVSVLTYFLLGWVKKSVDLIASGDMSEVLQMNEEEGIVDLF